MTEFAYYFAQREALETIIYLYDVVGAQDKHDMMRFDWKRPCIRKSTFHESLQVVPW